MYQKKENSFSKFENQSKRKNNCRFEKFSFGEYSRFEKKFNYSKKKFIYEYVINAAYK